MKPSLESIYPHLEHVLAQELGLAPEAVKEARHMHLHRGSDWDLVKRQVRLTDWARTRVLEVLGCVPAARPADLTPNGSKANTAETAPVRELNGIAAPTAPAKQLPGSVQGPFVHKEHELAARLGLRQKQLCLTRASALKPGIYWAMVDGAVCYSARGLERLLSILKVPAAAVLTTPSPTTATAAIEAPAAAGAPMPIKRLPGAQEQLIVHKLYKINKRIVEAHTAAGELVLVRVRDNANLMPGMPMKCRFGSGRIWELAQRLPRRKGHW